MNIYTKLPRKKTKKEFFKSLYVSKNNKGENIIKVPTTYSNKECTVLQCRADKDRSIEDLYAIMKTKYSSITYKQLIQIILTVDIKDNKYKKYPAMVSCPDIKRHVLYYSLSTAFMRHFKFNSTHLQWNKLLIKVVDKVNNITIQEYIKKHRK